MNWHDVTSWDPQQIIAVATSVYAFFAILLWLAILSQTVVANKAANAAKQSADTAYKVLVLTHRPRVVVQKAEIQEPEMGRITVAQELREVQVFKGLLLFHNAGGSRATIVEAGCWVFLIEGKLPMQRPYDADGYEPNATVEYPKIKGALLPGDDAVIMITQPSLDVIPGAQDPLELWQRLARCSRTFTSWGGFGTRMTLANLGALASAANGTGETKTLSR